MLYRIYIRCSTILQMFRRVRRLMSRSHYSSEHSTLRYFLELCGHFFEIWFTNHDQFRLFIYFYDNPLFVLCSSHNTWRRRSSERNRRGCGRGVRRFLRNDKNACVRKRRPGHFSQKILSWVCMNSFGVSDVNEIFRMCRMWTRSSADG